MSLVFPITYIPKHIFVGQIVLVGAFLGLSWPIVLLRFWTRRVIVRSLGWDDWTVLITTVLFTAYCCSELKTAAIVNARVLLTPDRGTASIAWLRASESFYCLTMIVLKISLAIFFLRIMVEKWQKRTIYAATASSTLAGAIFFFFSIFQCGTAKNSYVFLLRSISGECATPGTIVGIAYFNAAVITLTDLIFAFLPIPMLYKLHMNKRERWTVGFILVLGTTGVIASMVRINYIAALGSPSVSFYSDITKTGIWSTIEPGLGIIAGSLATLRPFFRSFLRNVRSLRGSGQESAVQSDKVISGGSDESLRPTPMQSLIDNETVLIGALIQTVRSAKTVQVTEEPWTTP